MPELRRKEATLHYDTATLVPPWADEIETIVFCHGIGIDMGIWSEWLPVLAGRYRTVRFDLRGFGRSSVPDPGFAWSMELLAGDVLAVARAAGANRFHLVGESLGGTVALYMAVHHDDAVLSATAISTAHKGGAIREVSKWRGFIEHNGMEAWSREMMAWRFAPGAVPEATWNWFHAVQSACSADSVLGLIEFLKHEDLSEDLPRIRIPVLLLQPDSSPFVPVALTAEAHALIPNAEMQVFPGARHGLACSHARECAQALLGFLDRHRG